jgi:hypothetical protein
MPRRKIRSARECKAENCSTLIGEEVHLLRLYCSEKCSRLQWGRNADRRQRYGVYGATLEDYDRLFMEQGGRCAICGSDNPGSRKISTRFAFDHDHESGRARGLLCYLCNIGLGSFQDNPETLRAAIAYLEFHSKPRDNRVSVGPTAEH